MNIPGIGIITRFLSAGTPESSKRLFSGACIAALCLIAFALTEAMCYQAHRNWAVSTALAASFSFVVGSIAWVAKAFYLKPDNLGANDAPKPGTPDESEKS